MDILRREFIKKSVGLLSLAGLSGFSAFHFLGNKRGPTFQELLSQFRKDKVDKNFHYLILAETADGHCTHYDFGNRYEEIHSFIRTRLAHHVPQSGAIVELGVFEGQSAKVLKEQFGESRYMGVDVFEYAPVDGVTITDIRNLHELKDQAAMVWNDLSSWKGSPRSRMAGFRWAHRNLQSGGIYIDQAVDKLPVDLDMKGMELIHQGKSFSVFRKA